VYADLFGSDLPPGFSYRPEFISADEEQLLLDSIRRLTFADVRMHGAVARRRTVHCGWTYGYDARRAEPGKAIPAFLFAVRARIGAWMAVEPEALAEVLITEYTPGAPIGWHRDARMFDEIAGVSLAGACRMKFRPYVPPRELGPPGRPARRTTHEIDLEPRSAYLLRGVVRREFEHSIPPVEQARYSITFRTMTRAGGVNASGWRNAAR
jgi:alkylated DNA repair dioxygenase AlkB